MRIPFADALKFAITILLLMASQFAYGQQQAKQEQVRAAYVFNFIEHIRWPNDGQIDTFKIGVYGDNTEQLQAFSRGVSGLQIRGKSISVERVTDISGLDFHVLFIDEDKKRLASEVYANTIKTQTLIVTVNNSEYKSFMLNLVNQNDSTIRFEVNRLNMIFEELQYDSKLLAFGGTELQVAQMFKEEELELQNVKKQLQQQRNLLQQQQQMADENRIELQRNRENLKQITEQNLAQQESNKRQQQKLAIQSQELLELEDKVAEKAQQVTTKEQLLQILLEDFEAKEAELNATESRLKSIVEGIKVNEQIIAKQQADIGEQQQRLAEQTSNLALSEQQLDTQFRTMVVLGCALIAIISLAAKLMMTGKARKEANLTLSKQHQELELAHTSIRKLSWAVEQSISSVVIYDLNRKIEYANESFKKRSGYSTQELLGQSPDLFLPDIESKRLLEGVWKGLEQGTSWSGEIVSCRKNGEHYWISVSVSPIKDDHGKILHYLSVSEDITEKKQFETELLAAKEQEMQANKAKSEFLATMSHEIRTPMNVVSGMIHLIKTRESSPETKKLAEKIEKATNSLLHVINDCLDFSKIEAGELVIVETRFSVNQLLEDVTGMIKEAAFKKGIEIILNVAPDTPDVLVGDPMRLNQILMNLCSNALKFTESGEIEISAYHTHKEQNATLHFSVRDTGIGLTKSESAELFKPFRQADGSISRKYGGTGLGLTISKQLCNLMEGGITVSSEKGVGSEFSFYVVTQFEQSNSLLKSVNQHHPFEGCNIIVVDDSETAVSVLTCMLEQFDFNVYSARDGDEAIKLYRQLTEENTRVDAVLLDWLMPGITGIQTAEAMFSIPNKTKRPKFIIASSHFEEDVLAKEQLDRAIDQQFIDDSISKPYSASNLFNILVKNLGYGELHHTKEIQVGDEEDLDRAKQAISGANVLLVEDNELNQEVATELLADSHVTTQVVDNGMEALIILENASSSVFDAILMDIQMPGMDGYETMEKVRKLPGWDTIPIIAMTANTSPDEQDKCFESGADDFIGKPVSHRVLYKTLAKWVNIDSPIPDTRASVDLIESDLNLSTLTLLDHEFALELIGGNISLYHKLLWRFKQNAPALFAQLTQDSASSMETRIRAVHTLKSLAASVGHKAISEQSDYLEAELKNDTPLSQFGTQIEQLQKELTSVMEELETLPALPNSSPAMQTGNLEQITQDLRAALTDADTKSSKLFKQYEAMAKSANGESELLEEMANSINNYDYKTALEVFEKIEA